MESSIPSWQLRSRRRSAARKPPTSRIWNKSDSQYACRFGGGNPSLDGWWGRTAFTGRLCGGRSFMLRSDDKLGRIGERIIGVPAIPLEECSRFDRKRLVQNIAFDV